MLGKKKTKKKKIQIESFGATYTGVKVKMDKFTGKKKQGGLKKSLKKKILQPIEDQGKTPATGKENRLLIRGTAFDDISPSRWGKKEKRLPDEAKKGGSHSEGKERLNKKKTENMKEEKRSRGNRSRKKKGNMMLCNVVNGNVSQKKGNVSK